MPRFFRPRVQATLEVMLDISNICFREVTKVKTKLPAPAIAAGEEIARVPTIDKLFAAVTLVPDGLLKVNEGGRGLGS
jgi:hypothetical protein